MTLSPEDKALFGTNLNAIVFMYTCLWAIQLHSVTEIFQNIAIKALLSTLNLLFLGMQLLCYCVTGISVGLEMYTSISHTRWKRCPLISAACEGQICLWTHTSWSHLAVLKRNMNILGHSQNNKACRLLRAEQTRRHVKEIYLLKVKFTWGMALKDK